MSEEGEEADDDDDDATAVGSDEGHRAAGDDTLARSDTRSFSSGKLSAVAKIFDAGVSVKVNGTMWNQVVMGDQGADESIIIVYGLAPDSTYQIELLVGHRRSGSDRQGASMSLHTATASDSIHSANDPDNNGAASSNPSVAPTTEVVRSTPSGAPSDTGTGSPVSSSATGSRDASQASVELQEAESQRNTLTNELRLARKDASRAEQALRNEIEAIKRSLDRLSSTDHRSKQKVLALQESIRQGNQSAKDIAQEAQEIEDEHAQWEDEARTLCEQETEARQNVESVEAENNARVKEDEDLTAVAEKELSALLKTMTSRQSEVEKLEQGRMAELEQEINTLQAEISRVENAPTPPLPSTHQNMSGWQRGASGFEPQVMPFQPSPAGGGHRSVSGPTPRGSFKGDRGGRGVSNRGGFRATSGPHSHPHPHRRGRGGAGISASGSHGYAGQPYAGVHGEGMSGGFPSPSSMPNIPPAGLPPGAAARLPFSNDGQTIPAYANNNPGYPPAHPAQPGSGLNPASHDFVPSSAHGSPVINKGMRNLSPLPPSVNAGNATWNPSPPIGSTSATELAGTAGVGGGRLPLGRAPGLPSGTTPVAHGTQESPLLGGHRSQFGNAAFNRGANHYDASAGAPNYYSSHPLNFASASGAHPLHGEGSRRRRAPSFDLLDYTNDSAFDPTAPAEAFMSPEREHTAPPVTSSYHGNLNPPGHSQFSPWSRTAEDSSPIGAPLAPSQGAAGGMGGLWASASSPIGPGHVPGPLMNNADDIWSAGSGSSRALRTHSSLLAGTSNLYGSGSGTIGSGYSHPHHSQQRSGSGSSQSSHSVGAAVGQTSTPTSPAGTPRIETGTADAMSSGVGATHAGFGAIGGRWKTEGVATKDEERKES
ncbi:unnamed protein product [Jaminaea pallidilutea]